MGWRNQARQTAPFLQGHVAAAVDFRLDGAIGREQIRLRLVGRLDYMLVVVRIAYWKLDLKIL